MTTLMLDTNIFNRLVKEASMRAVIRRLIEAEQVRVVATTMIQIELIAGPLRGLPDWFPIELELESVAVVGYGRVGMCRIGDGEVYKEHKGQSKQAPDGIIADSADSMADIFVSDDRRCRERLKKISTRCQSKTFEEFKAWVEHAGA